MRLQYVAGCNKNDAFECARTHALVQYVLARTVAQVPDSRWLLVPFVRGAHANNSMLIYDKCAAFVCAARPLASKARNINIRCSLAS